VVGNAQDVDQTTPDRGSDDLPLGRNQIWYRCEHCGYFGPILSETANPWRIEIGF